MVKKLLTIVLPTYALGFLVIGLLHADFDFSGDLAQTTQEEKTLELASLFDSMSPAVEGRGVTDVVSQVGKVKHTDDVHWSMTVNEKSEISLKKSATVSFEHSVFQLDPNKSATELVQSDSKENQTVSMAAVIKEIHWNSFRPTRLALVEVLMFGIMGVGLIIGTRKLAFKLATVAARHAESLNFHLNMRSSKRNCL